MRADRLISLVLLLQERGWTTTTLLADELGVSRRTVLRDLEALSLSGVPVMAEGGPGGGVGLDPGYRTTLTGLKEAEVKALLAVGDPALLDDLGWGQAYRQGQSKVKASVPRKFESGLDQVRRRLVIDSRWWWHQTPDAVFDTLQSAVWGDGVIEAEYETWEGTLKTYRLEAYGLVAKAGLWYFVGRRDEWRTYRVSRFRDLRVVGAFVRDPLFDLAQWWPLHSQEFAQSFSGYRFSVALPADAVRYLRAIAPGRVDVRGPWDQRAQWVVAEVGLDSSLYAELVVLGLNEGVVLDPPELAEAVVHRARQALDQYGPRVGSHKFQG